MTQWLSWAETEFSIEGIKFENFKMAGKQLLALGCDAFIRRSPPYAGEILWEHLQTLQKGEEEHHTCKSIATYKYMNVCALFL